MHPEVQRQLVGLLRDVNPSVLLATHSVEILGEADPAEILLVDKRKKSARRIKDVEGVQETLETIGSVQNIKLTELARNQKLLFVEGGSDYKLLRRFAKKAGYFDLSTGIGLTALDSGGLGSTARVKALAWGFKKSLGSELSVAAIYDRDYLCDEEILELRADLEKDLVFTHFHERKEIENYLLQPEVLERLVSKLLADKRKNSDCGPIELDTKVILEKITDQFRDSCQSQYISKYAAFHSHSSKDAATLTHDAISWFNERWMQLERRIFIVPGKKTLRALRDELQTTAGISLTDVRIVDAYNVSEIPGDILILLNNLDDFRTKSN